MSEADLQRSYREVPGQTCLLNRGEAVPKSRPRAFSLGVGMPDSEDLEKALAGLKLNSCEDGFDITRQSLMRHFVFDGSDSRKRREYLGENALATTSSSN